MPELTPETLKAFLSTLEERRKQAPSIRQLEKEAGLYHAVIYKIASGDIPLTEQTAAKLTPVLEKYGFRKINDK